MNDIETKILWRIYGDDLHIVGSEGAYSPGSEREAQENDHWNPSGILITDQEYSDVGPVEL